jgi:hypothetical protein
MPLYRDVSAVNFWALAEPQWWQHTLPPYRQKVQALAKLRATRCDDSLEADDGALSPLQKAFIGFRLERCGKLFLSRDVYRKVNERTSFYVDRGGLR